MRVPQSLKNATRFVWVPLEARIGRLGHLRKHRRMLADLPSIEQAIGTIERRWPAAGRPPTDDPIFVLSAGWRSGSTLLQRLVLSGGKALIWGEPYDHCDFVRRLTDGLRGIGESYPPDRYVRSAAQLRDHVSMWGEWDANLYPHPRHLVEAQRAFFQRLYAEPAQAAGFTRWGLKEVRLGTEHAVYLRWLFPKACFLLLYRNPYHAYRSYRIFRDYYDRWPQEVVLTPAHYGRIWRELATGFLADHGKVDGLLVKFEDLTSRALPVRRISDYVGMELREEVLNRKVSGRGDFRPHPIPASELRLLRREVEPLASSLGYEP